MRRMKLVGLALSAVLAWAPRARAQSSGGTTSPGSCKGGVMGSVGLSIGATNPQSVAATSVPFMIGNAECECATTDINLEIKLSQAFPQNTTGTLELWVGQNCDNLTTRSAVNQTQCEKLNTTATFQEFVQGSTAANTFIEVPINSQALTSPQIHTCDPAKLPQASNSIFLLLITNDPSMPSECTLSLTEFNQGPTAASNVSASSGDSAVTVGWQPPPVSGSIQPTFFQLLCATADGKPIPGIKPSDQAYSTCINGVIKRRAVPTASSLGSTGTDGGVTSAFDLGTASDPLGGADEPLGTDATDGGTGTTITNSAFATTLDPSFICSDKLQVSGTSYAQRIGGLTNNQPYQFVVLSIDKYGNATPSPVVVGVPKPTENLWSRYYDAGGRGGFCEVGGGLALVGDGLLVVLVLLGIGLAWRRRRA